MRQSRGAMKLLIPFAFAFASMLSAQDAPKKDPFIKDKKPAVAPQPADQEANITFFLESFTLPQADFAAWLEMPEGREKLHEKVLAAVKAGTAKLDACHFARGKGGTRFTLESVDELLYPSEWNYADAKGFQYPVAFEMKQVGEKLEVEPTLEPSDMKLNLNHSFERVRFLGLRASKADRTLPGLVVPDFQEQRGPAMVSLLARLPALLHATAAGEGQITLTFITPRVVPVPRPAQAPPQGAGNIVLTPRVISLERLRAWEMLRQHAEDGPAILKALKPMLADGSAVLEHVSTLSGKAGMRILHEAVRQHYYGTEFNPPTEGAPAKPSDDPKKTATPATSPSSASTTSFDYRRIGFNWEAETTLSHEGDIIHTNIAFDLTSFAGNLADPLWDERYPEMPVFVSQKFTTGVTQVAGSTILLSTLNPPGDTGVNGRKDGGRVWLLFLTEELE